MTPALVEIPIETRVERPEPARATYKRTMFVLPLWLWGCLFAAGGLLVAAYSNAQRSGSSLHVDIFWLGELLFIVPLVCRMVRPTVDRTERLAMLALLGIFDYVPKFLRDPLHPLYFDENAHYLQTVNIIKRGRPFLSNPIINEIQGFPGLHLWIAGLHDLSGVPVFTVASLAIAFLHAATLLGVYALGERLAGSSIAGGVAAVLYSINPGFLFFDSEYAYETLAIPLLIWTLVAGVEVLQRKRGDAQRLPWLVTGLLLGATCAVTHHLTTYYLVVWLVCLGLVNAKGLRPSKLISRTPFWALPAAVGATAVAWLIWVAPYTVQYLSPYFGTGLAQIFNQASGKAAGRRLFQGSTLPVYERVASFLVPVILICLCGWALWRGWHQLKRLPSHMLAFWFAAGAYFASLPFILTTFGAEGARRSWDLSFLGVAVVLAGPIADILRLASRSRWVRSRRVGIACFVLAILLVGNVGSGLDETYQFPGPYVYGSDTRSETPELFGLIDWFRRTQGSGNRFVADRYVSTPLDTFGGDYSAEPSTGFPAYDLYFWKRPPHRALLQQLYYSDYRYLVVDKRSENSVPEIGVYFTPDEPLAYQRTSPIPHAAITKFQRFNWLEQIYASTHFEVFRILRPALRMDMR